MKIEKLTENKIRIILKQEEFINKTTIINNSIFSSPEFQKLFLKILNKAQKEVNFNVDGYKLLIELFSQNDDSYIFTVTKYIEAKSISKNKSKKYILKKEKKQYLNNTLYIYCFNEFEDFCNFCDFINRNNTINLKGIFKKSTLYLYNNIYYLIIENINLSHKSLSLFNSSLLEFSYSLRYTKEFKFKLEEYGKVLIKNNAIHTGIKYF